VQRQTKEQRTVVNDAVGSEYGNKNAVLDALIFHVFDRLICFVKKELWR
jgi:hypothetical protein